MEKQNENNWYLPFPEIQNLFFTDVDGVAMFDAARFLNGGDLAIEGVAGYFSDCQAEIDRYTAAAGVGKGDLLKIGPGGVTVTHSVLAMSFICWASVDAKLYCLESFRNLLGDGFATSNRYIASEAGHRFGVDVNKVVNGED